MGGWGRGGSGDASGSQRKKVCCGRGEKEGRILETRSIKSKVSQVEGSNSFRGALVHEGKFLVGGDDVGGGSVLGEVALPTLELTEE